MKVFKGITILWDLYMDASSIKHGCYWQSEVDEYHIRVLQNYRMVAAFVVPTLTAAEQVDERYQACIRKIIDECEDVLKDESIYIVVGKGNPKLSKKLEESVEGASNAIAHAGNLCNELMCALENRVPEKIMALITRARDMCNRAIRIKHFS